MAWFLYKFELPHVLNYLTVQLMLKRFVFENRTTLGSKNWFFRANKKKTYVERLFFSGTSRINTCTVPWSDETQSLVAVLLKFILKFFFLIYNNRKIQILFKIFLKYYQNIVALFAPRLNSCNKIPFSVSKTRINVP
jgi:hypothetical protein